MPPNVDLTRLQVKAELNKLSDAPRAYSEKLNADEMAVVSGSSGRMGLGDRFARIQGARQAPHQAVQK